MSRFFLPFILLAVAGSSLAVTPAGAQFGSIFGEPPPRPPQSVPGRQQPQQRLEEPPPTLQPPGPPGRPRQPQGNIQSQPLPPPPGGAASPGIAPNAPAPQPAQRPARGAPQQQPPQQQQQQQQPVEAAVPSDEVATQPPGNKVPNPTGVFAGLDKITGRITSFDVALNETVQFGALQVTPRACYTRPPTETPHTDAFIEVDEVTLQGEIRRIYTGWMFAASPGLHAVEHPIYDVWLTDCKGGVVAEAQPEPEPAPRAARQQQQPSQQQQRQPPRERRAPQRDF
ncbi:MAG TPA: DUF2155 domain-containing protein [Xanthobacteraceae bacterium]|nr:DUF2155 domain-containing protein [Xanthobacteraceae bacterium]